MVATAKGRKEPIPDEQSRTKKRRVAGPSEDTATAEAGRGREHLSEPQPSTSAQSQDTDPPLDKEAGSGALVTLDQSEDRAEIEEALQRRLDTLQNEQQNLLRTMYRARIDQEILLTARNTIDLRIRELQNRRADAQAQTADQRDNERG